jgi:hypothetical protein
MVPEPRVQDEQVSAPTTGAGKGSFYVKDAAGISEAFYVDDTGQEIQLTENGVPKGGGVTDHGALTGLGDDDHTQYHNDTRGDARYYQQSEHINVSAGVADAGKPARLDAAGLWDSSMIPPVASSGQPIEVQDEGVTLTTDATKFNFAGAGVAVTEPVPDELLVTISGGGGGGTPFDLQNEGVSVDADLAQLDVIGDGHEAIPDQPATSQQARLHSREYQFTLPANATMGGRVGLIGTKPKKDDGTDWDITTADLAGEANFGSLITTLVMTHGLADKVAKMEVMELTDSGPTTAQGFRVIDLTNPADRVTNTAKTKCAIIDLQSKASATRDILVLVKLI